MFNIKDYDLREIPVIFGDRAGDLLAQHVRSSAQFGTEGPGSSE